MTYREIAARMVADGEGLVLVVYDDATGKPLKRGDTLQGHPTIGYGRNLAAKGISEDEAQAMLAVDLTDAEVIAMGFVGGTVWRSLSDVRRAVLMDMAHNLGSDGLYAFAKLRGALERADYERAAREIEDSRYFRQVKRRGERNRDAMRSGAWGGNVLATTERPKAPAPDAPGRRWGLMRRIDNTHTVYWLGGNTQPGQSVMVNAVETPFLHLAARLTRLQAQDALERQGRVLALQGWELFEVAPLEEWGE